MKRKSLCMVGIIMVLCCSSVTGCGKVVVKDQENGKKSEVSVGQYGVHVTDEDSEVNITSKGIHVKDGTDEVIIDYEDLSKGIEKIIDGVIDSLDNVDGHVSITVNGREVR